MLKDLVYKCRSYRRFYENIRISEEELKDLVDLARMTASTANSQALKYHLVTRPEECAAVFGTLGWAGALPDWDGPEVDDLSFGVEGFDFPVLSHII